MHPLDTPFQITLKILQNTFFDFCKLFSSFLLTVSCEYLYCYLLVYLIDIYIIVLFLLFVVFIFL